MTNDKLRGGEVGVTGSKQLGNSSQRLVENMSAEMSRDVTSYIVVSLTMVRTADSTFMSKDQSRSGMLFDNSIGKQCLRGRDVYRE